MDSLLCDEDWLGTSPTHDYDTENDHKIETCMGSFYNTREDYQNALILSLQKEPTYMPKPGYTCRLSQSSDLLHCRTKAIQFFIKSKCRWSLDLETVFNAMNYFDRFISMNQCNIATMGLVELLSVACLSIAAKFVEVSIPQLHEIQMEDLDYSFQSSMIQQMELTVLKALEWRVCSTTPYSYIELFLGLLDSLQPAQQVSTTSRVTELLLDSLSDSKFVEFRPCTVAVSALRCSLEELLPSKSNTYLSNLLTLIPQDQKENINTCHKIMEEQVADPIHSLTACGFSYFPSSPVTVMPIQQTNIFNSYIGLSLFVASDSKPKFPTNPKKRKREETNTTNLML